MNTLSRCRIALLLSAMALLAGTNARADLIYTQSGVAGGWTPGDGTEGGNYGFDWIQGTVSSSTSGSYGGSAASASVDLLANPGIRLYSRSFSNPIFGSGSETFSAAQWRDVIQVGGLTEMPSTLRIQVEMEGVIQLNVYESGPSAVARVGIVELADTYGFFDLFDGYASDVANYYSAPFSEVWAIVQPGGASFLNSNTQGLFYDPVSGNIRWTATFDISYSSTYDGYIYNLYSTARTASVTGGEATADFSNTMRLVGVTLTDGGPVSGDITFISGFQLSAVPEPSSVVMMSTGAIALLVYFFKHRRASRA